MTSKAKLIIANVLIIFGFLCIASGIIMLFVANKEVFGIVCMFVAGVIFLIVGGVFWKNSNHPVIGQPKVQKPNKPKKPKRNKNKKVFMTEEEWKEQEEEDDEMMFIEEVVEDD